MNRGSFATRIIYSIKNLSPIGKAVLAIAIFFVVSIPFVLSAVSPNVQKDSSPLPSRPPLPTFPDAPRVEGELSIQYAENQGFNNLEKNRQQEITVFFEKSGVISQEKIFEATEGELSTYYLLKFKKGIDIDVAAQRIYELPEIMGIEPNYEVGLF